MRGRDILGYQRGGQEQHLSSRVGRFFEFHHFSRETDDSMDCAVRERLRFVRVYLLTGKPRGCLSLSNCGFILLRKIQNQSERALPVSCGK
jgi:hypothetical protein